MILIFEIMLMAIHCMPVHETLILSFLNLKKTPKEFLDGFMTIAEYQRWKKLSNCEL